MTHRRIVSSVAEFPGVAHAWLATRVHGWQVDLVQDSKEGIVNANHFLAAIDETTALISLPHVCYANGMMLELEPIVAAAHAQDTLVFVDAYQSVGTVPIDVKASGVDFLAAGDPRYPLRTGRAALLSVNPRQCWHTGRLKTG